MHRAATEAFQRISDDTIAEIASELSLKLGMLLSGQTIRGILVLSMMEALMMIVAEELNKKGQLEYVPLNMRGRAERQRILAIFDELMTNKRFCDFFERNFRIRDDKNEKAKTWTIRVDEGNRLKMPAVPMEQAKELRQLLKQADVADPDAMVKRVLSVFDAEIREEARILPVTPEVRRLMAEAAERGEEALPGSEG